MSKHEKVTEPDADEPRREDLKRIPRRHRAEPKDLEPQNSKVRITMWVDSDVVDFFKKRAGATGAAGYQTQMNAALREATTRGENSHGADLVADDRFIEAVAERLRTRRGGQSR